MLAVLKRLSKTATLLRPDGSLCFPTIDRRIDVAIRLENGPSKQKYIGTVFIVGNKRTDNAVILDCIGLEPGEEIDYPKIREAEKKLAALGLFEGAPKITVEDKNGGNFKTSSFR